MLELTGNGKYIFAPLDAEKRLALEEEKQSLERQLMSVPALRARLEDMQEEKARRRSGHSTPAPQTPALTATHRLHEDDE